MAQDSGALQMLWIERPALAVANTASIHQGSRTTGAVTVQRLVGRAQADSSLRGMMDQGLSVLNVSMTICARLTGGSRALVWLCMGCEVSGSEVTPGT